MDLMLKPSKPSPCVTPFIVFHRRICTADFGIRRKCAKLELVNKNLSPLAFGDPSKISFTEIKLKKRQRSKMSIKKSQLM
jgi:hypothetical protein